MTKRTFLVVALCGLPMLLLAWPGLAALGAPGPAGPRPDPKADLIAFGSTTGLWTVWGDGSHLRQLLADPWPSDPTWSPDGARLAFVRYDVNTGTTSLWVLQLKHGLLWPITEAAYYNTPTWSPDGRRLYAGDGLGRMVTIDVSDLADPGAPEYFTNPPAGVREWSPACGPDGRIAYGKATDVEGPTIWILDPDTGDEWQVIGDPSSFPPSGPSWSPDGSFLAYLLNMRPAGPNRICVSPLDGELPNLGTPLVDLFDRGVRPAWSQTGRWLYFTMRDPYIEGIEELYRVDVEGGPAVQLVSANQVGGPITNPSVTPSPAAPGHLGLTAGQAAPPLSSAD